MCIIKTATTTVLLATLACCELSYKANANPNVAIAPQQPGDRVVALQKDSTPALKQLLHSRKFKAADLAQAPTLTDLEGNWARGFITALVSRGVIQGFPDGSFRPNEPVTRAQFAAIVSKAFPQNPSRQAIAFADVPEYYWAKDVIQTAYQTGFLAGYPNSTFLPEQSIPRVQVLVALANGLNLSAAEPSTLLDASYQDAAEIPDFARSPVAAATSNRLVVNYPDKNLLQPNQIATRADVAAFIYQALASKGEVPQLTAADAESQYVVGLQLPATTPPAAVAEAPPSEVEIQKIETQLQALQRISDFGNIYQGSPGITVSIPSGFGPDLNTVYLGLAFQDSTRQSSKDDGAIGFGIGFGNSRKNIGVELGYTVASVTADYTAFGEGGFNIKLHRQLAGDWALAVGYNNFIEVGEDNDFENSLYGVVTKIIRTRPDVNSAFSRVALNVGIGNGQFRSESAIDGDRDSFNIFGGAAIRIAQPASFIAEWTGQDLSLGLSIQPFKKSSWTITPALRDIAGAGDGARFVLGSGFSFRF
jgi:S-layer homology domain